MSTTISTNMGMAIPVVGSETGPQWATDLNACLTVIDQHDHSAGAGVQITPAGIDINGPLDMGNNSLTNTEAVVLTAQASYSTNKSLYVIGDEVYFRDGAGNQVQITNGGSVNAGAGSITGLPSGTASVTFTSIDGKFTFQQATSTAADIDAGAILLRNTSPNSTYALTLQPPAALASNYSITLPSLPASTKIMAMDSSGVISVPYSVDNSTIEISSNVIQVKDLGITTAKLAALSVTTAKIDDLGVTTAKIAAGAVTNTKLDTGAAASNITAGGLDRYKLVAPQQSAQSNTRTATGTVFTKIYASNSQLRYYMVTVSGYMAFNGGGGTVSITSNGQSIIPASATAMTDVSGSASNVPFSFSYLVTPVAVGNLTDTVTATFSSGSIGTLNAWYSAIEV